MGYLSDECKLAENKTRIIVEINYDTGGYERALEFVTLTLEETHP